METVNTPAPLATDRRAVIKTGAGALAALAGLGAITAAQAQGTPEAGESGGRAGMYAVTRAYVIKDDASVDELNALVEEFSSIISGTEGFLSYDVIFDESNRGYITVGVFDNQESADASNEAAADFISEHNLGDYYVDTNPVTVQGLIAVSASA